MEYKIIFEPSGIQAMVKEGENLLQVARKNSVGIEAACGGKVTCGKCKIKVIEGTFNKHGITSEMTHLSVHTKEEISILTKEEIEKNYRLACAVRIYGDLIVEIPKESRTVKQVILSTGKSKSVSIIPNVEQYLVSIEPPSLSDSKDDKRRLQDILLTNYPQLDRDITISYYALKKLSREIRNKENSVTVVLSKQKKIIDINTTPYETLYGVAVDIGTTTIAAYLMDLTTGLQVQSASMMNPQISYGDDVISRISYCGNDWERVEELQKIVIGGINQLILKMVNKEKISTKNIVEAVFVGNTVMNHIAMGISPQWIGKSPFVATVSDGIDISSQQIGLDILPEATIYFLPVEAGFVGADNVAVLITEELYKEEKMKLIIDIGTNSEICYGNKERLFVTSCATGPALEGAQISCGMRAAKGAIDQVKISPVNLEAEIHILGEEKIPRGICGSGIIDVVAQMAVTGVILPDGRFSSLATTSRIRENRLGIKEYVLYFGDGDISDIVVTQKDVEAVQLAKGALYAGIQMLMKKSHKNTIDEVILAGGFGSYINKENALLLGMFPDCQLAKVSIAGNAAGEGAKIALINREKRAEAEKVAKEVVFVETATEIEYQKFYTNAMTIPNKLDSFILNGIGGIICGGDDKRILPSVVYTKEFSILENTDDMKKAFLDIQLENKAKEIRMPLVQNLEAVVYGAGIQKCGNTWSVGDYCVDTLEELEHIDFSLLGDTRVQTILEVISEMKTKKIILEVEAPFSILAALISPLKLYRYARRKPELLKTILHKIAIAEGEYIMAAIQAGCQVISLADPTGVVELTGEKFYTEYCGTATVEVLNQCKRSLRNAVIHLCGKVSRSLIMTSMAVVKPYRVADDSDYIEAILEIAENRKIKYIGQGCLNRRKMALPIVYTLELR